MIASRKLFHISHSLRGIGTLLNLQEQQLPSLPVPFSIKRNWTLWNTKVFTNHLSLSCFFKFFAVAFGKWVQNTNIAPIDGESRLFPLLRRTTLEFRVCVLIATWLFCIFLCAKRDPSFRNLHCLLLIHDLLRSFFVVWPRRREVTF